MFFSSNMIIRSILTKVIKTNLNKWFLMNIISYVVKTKAVDTGAARCTYGLFNLLILKNQVSCFYT